MKAFKNEKSKLTTNSREYKILTRYDDPYWDEGIKFHKSRGSRRKKKKQLIKQQVRLYRTWKYNRKTQWKEKN